MGMVKKFDFAHVAEGIARQAGALLRGFYAKGVATEYKGDVDLVTEADRASEQLIVEKLKAAFPAHGVYGEEGTRSGLESELRWYVDPLDGTTNFAHGFPMWNVTLALALRDEVIAGVVYDPLNRELFAAEKGGGARLNGAPIHVSKAPVLNDSLVATGFPSRKRHLNVNIHFYYQVAMVTHGVR